jgi:predicted unusual protein kinase regulating ubiquinone biosynthesis (AarF/ABC1/UbiB family)
MPAPYGQFGRRLQRPAAAHAPAAIDLAAQIRAEPPPAATLDRGRYLRVAFFFARVFLSFIGWDLILRHIPGFRNLAVTNSVARWRSHAQRYRRLAVRYGGVLIKLGQFLSIRVDVLPADVTSELRGLQDEVPAESLDDVKAVIAGEFKRPTEEVFAWFSPQPEAAASLAQVHKARLVTGEEVVVKVQRPRIEQLVETDLAALHLAISWLKLYRPVTRRVDLDRLYAEFFRTTRAELDFIQEGRNADRFAADFASDPGIYIADVFWEVTTRRVLTLENVASIKIDDVQAMEAAGISRAEVARKLYDTYLEQIFVHSFVHADPHPGNLFVHPLGPEPNAGAAADGGTAAQGDVAGVLTESRPFLLIFVDFGMVAVIPEAMRSALRDVAIAVGTRDAHRMVQAYVDAGVLLPGADRQRIEELHDVLFARLGGMKMGQLTGIAMQQAPYLLREYRDLLFEMPFQFPTDVVFAMRAVAILAGMATTLDRNFDPWAATLPFAERLAADELARNWRGALDEIGELARLALRLPARLDRYLTQAERGELVQQTALAPDAAKSLRRLERSVDRLTWALIAMGLLMAGMLLRTTDGPGGISTAALIGAGIVFIWGMTRR